MEPYLSNSNLKGLIEGLQRTIFLFFRAYKDTSGENEIYMMVAFQQVLRKRCDSLIIAAYEAGVEDEREGTEALNLRKGRSG